MEHSKQTLKSILRQVIDLATTALHTAFNITDEAIVLPVANKPGQDYQIPTCVKVFNIYKKTHNSFGCATPKDLAQVFKNNFPSNNIIDNIEINDQGFVYVHIKDSYLEQEINNILMNGINIEVDAPQTIVVDFSSPNIAKELHVGHLRGTIMGESLCRIFETQGHHVHRVNHLGDWGTQFGMLIQYMKVTYPDYLETMPSISDLNGFYKAAKKKFDEDAEFKKAAQQTVVDLQQGDPDCRKIWKMYCEISSIAYNKIYKRLDVSLKECGESFYNAMIPGVVQELEEKGFVTVMNGAKCMTIPGQNDPLVLQKTNGGYCYDTTDVAAAKYRFTELKADRIIIFTDLGQRHHFELIFEAARIAGWHQPPKTKMDHVGFGLILGPDGKRLQTRSGESIPLTDLLDEATKRAAEQLKIRAQENQSEVDEDKIGEAAEKIGIAAIKYFDMKNNKVCDYKFNYDNMLDPRGNTAVYLLYSYARICSVLNKAGATQENISKTLSQGGFKITTPHEKLLAISLLKFAEVIETVVEELSLHKLCDYVYDVCTKVAEWYSNTRIIGDPNMDTRLVLCEAVKKVLQKAFYLLGITPLEKI